MNETINPLAQQFKLSSLLKFAFPSILMMVFMGLYTILDTIFVSKFVNIDAMSAINIVCPIINVIVGLSAMIATGGNAIVARKMGENKSDRANQDFTFLTICGTILGILIAVIGTIFIDKIVWWLGANENLYSYSKTYLLIILIFTPFNILQGIFQNLIITAGKPKLGLLLSIGSGILNIILDYIFMEVMQMGIAGAAIGTGIGYTTATLIGIIFFFSGKGTLKFTKPIFDFKVLAETCGNGCSEMISQISTAITTFLFNIVMMKLMGEDGVAAITIIIYSQFMFTTVFIGFSIGVAPIISFNHGSKTEQTLKKVFKNCVIFLVTISILVWFITLLGGSYLVRFFSPIGTEIYEITYEGLRIFKYSFLLCGLNIFASALFTALSDGKTSAIISFLRTFLFITVGLLILPTLLGSIGIWIAVPLAELLAFIISIIFVLKYKNKYHYL